MPLLESSGDRSLSLLSADQSGVQQQGSVVAWGPVPLKTTEWGELARSRVLGSLWTRSFDTPSEITQNHEVPPSGGTPARHQRQDQGPPTPKGGCTGMLVYEIEGRGPFFPFGGTATYTPQKYAQSTQLVERITIFF